MSVNTSPHLCLPCSWLCSCLAVMVYSLHMQTLICALLWLSACLVCHFPICVSIPTSNLMSCIFIFFFLWHYLFCNSTRVMSAIACFHLITHLHHIPSSLKSLLKNPASWLTPLATTLFCAPHLCLLPPWPALPCAAMIGVCLLMAYLWMAVVLVNGVVHQNMDFLLTGTTSVKSVSTRSRVKVCP